MESSLQSRNRARRRHCNSLSQLSHGLVPVLSDSDATVIYLVCSATLKHRITGMTFPCSKSLDSHI